MTDNNTNIENCINYGKVSCIDGSGAGGIVGNLKNSQLKNCVNKGIVYGKQNLGGIAGIMSNESIIKQSYNEGSIQFPVENPWTIGGIVGWSTGGEINSCYNVSDLEKGNQLGGIVGGCKDGTSLDILNCYNNANVSGVLYAGGIIGSVGSKDDAVTNISNCYNVGNVSGNENSNGPIYGRFESVENTNLIIDNTYYLSSVASNTAIGLDYEGVFSIENVSDMKSIEFVTTLGNEYVVSNKIVNDGYPILKWQSK